MKSTIINDSPRSLILKEGTRGVYRELSTLACGGRYSINVDINATYREYYLMSSDDVIHGEKKNFEHLLSSDDVIEYAFFTVILEAGILEVKRTPRGEEPNSGRESFGNRVRRSIGSFFRAYF